MNKKLLNISSVVGLGLAAVFLFLNRAISVGIIFGLLVFRLYFYLLTNSINDYIDSALYEDGKSLTILPKMVRLFVLILPYLGAFLLPEYISYIGVTIGLLIFKICVYVYSAVDRRKGGREDRS